MWRRTNAMAVKRQLETLSDLRRRDALASRVCARLRRDQRVVAVEAYGSLALGRADRYSDIDLVVRVHGQSDRAFAEAVPDLLDPLGPRLIGGWGSRCFRRPTSARSTSPTTRCSGASTSGAGATSMSTAQTWRGHTTGRRSSRCGSPRSVRGAAATTGALSSRHTSPGGRKSAASATDRWNDWGSCWTCVWRGRGSVERPARRYTSAAWNFVGVISRFRRAPRFSGGCG